MGIFDAVTQKVRFLYGLYNVFNSGGVNDASDGNIRDTAAHTVFIFDENILAASNRTIFVYNGLNQAITLTIQFRLSTAVAGVTNNIACFIYQASVASGAQLVLSSGAGGTGETNHVSVPALSDVTNEELVIKAQAGSVPSSGTLECHVAWRS